MPGGEIELFVFPLPRVSLFPRTSKPLNVFEPRYVSMVNDALENGTPIALAYSDPASISKDYGLLSHVRSIAGYGSVRLFERRPDETMLVLVEATGKVRLKEVVQRDVPYIVARGEKIEEKTELDPSQLFLLNRIMKRFRSRMEAHMNDARECDRFFERLGTSEEKLNAYCAIVVEDPEHRQRLLETDGVSARLSLATLLLDAESTSH